MSDDAPAYKYSVTSVMNTSMTHVARFYVRRADGKRERITVDPLSAFLLFPGDSYEHIGPS